MPLYCRSVDLLEQRLTLEQVLKDISKLAGEQPGGKNNTAKAWVEECASDSHFEPVEVARMVSLLDFVGLGLSGLVVGPFAHWVKVWIC